MRYLHPNSVLDVQPVVDRQWIGGNRLRIAVDDSIRVYRQ